MPLPLSHVDGLPGWEQEERLFFMGLRLASGLTYNARSHTFYLRIPKAQLREHAIGSTKAVCLHSKWGSHTQDDKTNKTALSWSVVHASGNSETEDQQRNTLF